MSNSNIDKRSIFENDLYKDFVIDEICDVYLAYFGAAGTREFLNIYNNINNTYFKIEDIECKFEYLMGNDKCKCVGCETYRIIYEEKCKYKQYKFAYTSYIKQGINDISKVKLYKELCNNISKDVMTNIVDEYAKHIDFSDTIDDKSYESDYDYPDYD